MMSERLGRDLCAAGGLWLAMLPSSASAQAQDELGVEVRVGLHVPRELITGLDEGLRAWDVRVVEQRVDSSCAPMLARADVRAAVSLNWEAGGAVLICFS